MVPAELSIGRGGVSGCRFVFSANGLNFRRARSVRMAVGRILFVLVMVLVIVGRICILGVRMVGRDIGHGKRNVDPLFDDRTASGTALGKDDPLLGRFE